MAKKRVTFKKKSMKKRVKRRVKKVTALSRPSIVTLGRGLPSKIMVTHKYHTFCNVTSNVGATATYQFKTNGMFDPDTTGLGHQPLYYDQFSALYDHWTVIGSKITYKISGAAVSQPLMQVAAWINDDSTVTPSTDALFEQTTSKRVVIPFASNNTYYLTNKWSAKRVFGGNVLANNALQGQPSSDPTEQQNFALSAYCPNGGTGTLDIEVNIEYIAIWTELKDMAAS